MFARRFAGAPLRSFARVLGAEVEGREDELDALAAAWLVRRIMGGLRKDMALGRMYVPMAVLSQAGATPQEMTAESLSAAARDALKEFAEAGLEELRRGERVLELLPADGSREWAAREVVRVRGDLEQWKARPEAAGAATRGGWKSVLGIFKGKES
jgi:phytoene/squalene synthetase